jgi:hypothetical protein
LNGAVMTTVSKGKPPFGAATNLGTPDFIASDYDACVRFDFRIHTRVKRGDVELFNFRRMQDRRGAYLSW